MSAGAAGRGRGEVTLVAAGAGDARTVYELRNDPFTVRYSGSGRPVAWEEHARWFADRVARPADHRLYLVRCNGETIGVLRFERRDARTAGISIYLAEQAVGRGIGTDVIRAGCDLIFRHWSVGSVEAEVIAGNERSVRAFRKAGFSPRSGAAPETSGCTLVRTRDEAAGGEPS